VHQNQNFVGMRTVIPKKIISHALTLKLTMASMKGTVKCSRTWWINILFCFSLFILISIIYYMYLNSLYLVDEVYDINGPREFILREKFTLRVKAPHASHLNQLKMFVEHYTICRSIEEIQIEWIDTINNMPSRNIFTFAHTHSKVVFEDRTMLSSSEPSYHFHFIPLHSIATEAVLLLDVDVMVSCEDLELWHSVWRSSGDALVGLYPRLHSVASSSSSSSSTSTSTSSAKYQVPQEGPYQYLGPLSVWWSGRYSLLLPAAVMLHRRYLLDLKADRYSEVVGRLATLLEKNAYCSDLALPLWSIHRAAPAPIWLDVTKNIVRVGAYESEPFLGVDRKSTCLTMLIRLFRIQDIEYSTFKSVRASTQLFW